MRGTNGLCFDAAFDFDFEFGPDSYLRHRKNALRLQRGHATAISPGLEFDVDTPDDLAELYQRDDYQQTIEAVPAR